MEKRISPISKVCLEAFDIFDWNEFDHYEEIREQLLAEWLGLDECDEVDYDEVLKYSQMHQSFMWG